MIIPFAIALSVQAAAGVNAHPVLLAARIGGQDIALAAIVFGIGGTLLYPLIRAFARRIEGGDGRKAVPSDLAARLERIERSVDAIAIEVERVSEGQRFVTQLLSERDDRKSLGPGQH